MRRLSTIALLLLLLAGWWWLQHPKSELQPITNQGGTTPVEAPSTTSELTGPKSQRPPVTNQGDIASVVASSTTNELPAFLPREAHTTLALIEQGGPFPHRQDGSVFGNREGHLPSKPRGFYREYTVETPRLGHRGARRIVTGGQPPAVYYYTDDHYDSFRSFELPP